MESEHTDEGKFTLSNDGRLCFAKPILHELGCDATSLTHKTIMIVEDEMTTMEVMRTYLEKAGYQKLVLVEDSSRVMREIKEHRPDILLLDPVKPGLTGFEILRQVRSHSQLQHIPVLILAPSSDADMKHQAVDQGATDFLTKPVDSSELILRVRNTLAARAYQSQLAYYDDALTKLPNRSVFLDRLSWFLQQAKRRNGNLVMLHITLNQFKRVANTFGPQVADQVINQIAERISFCIRRSDVVGRGIADVCEMDSLSRLDGDEFSLLCPTMAHTEHATELSSRILRIMEHPFDANGTEVYIWPSIGIASYPADANDSTTLLQYAVRASGQANAHGKGGFHFYSRDLNTQSFERLKMEADLCRAIEGGQLLLYYQPKIDVMSGSIKGVEALVRWQKPDGKLILPDLFIPLAEETGLIMPLGEWVLREACAQMARWQALGMTLQVAVNVSAKQFHDGNLVQLVSDTLKSNGVDAQYLTLELTESLLTENPAQALESVNQILGLGPRISMDDFGTGYSSLSNLKRLPIQELKIDRSFLTDITSNPEDQALVSAMIYLAHELGLDVVAEGVEAQEQLDLLTTLGCDQYQGYLFSRPVKLEDLSQMLSSLCVGMKA